MGSLLIMSVSYFKQAFIYSELLLNQYFRASHKCGIISQKAYMLSVCLIIHIIYLKFVDNCSVSTFINTYYKFCSHKDLLAAIYWHIQRNWLRISCDCATQSELIKLYPIRLNHKILFHHQWTRLADAPSRISLSSC